MAGAGCKFVISHFHLYKIEALAETEMRKFHIVPSSWKMVFWTGLGIQYFIELILVP